ncbi:hypothetical protein [Cellvibrio sp. OA-2007]|uniref:hypothetical protein n=1 Tax=Cellvibrio sp. OA-2007 TaxID=529823 RepID=UPI000781EB42|nr:hypothetical protein [Cellvibrio sp. OA-2007]
MTLIVILVFLMLITLFAVSVLHRIQQRQRQRRLEQRRLRIQVEELTDVVNCLEQTLPNRVITKHINDMIIALQHQMLALEDNNRERLESAILKSELYSEELINPKNRQGISYQRDSDAQIAKTQLYINEAVNLMVQLAAQGTINEVELDSYQAELRWAYLMVSVMSYIAQGDKSVAISDRLAFYRKAQHLLMESMHQDPRRLQMIKELSEMIDGERVGLSSALREMAPAA